MPRHFEWRMLTASVDPIGREEGVTAVSSAGKVIAFSEMNVNRHRVGLEA